MPTSTRTASASVIYPQVSGSQESYGGLHPTSGLPGFTAIDFMAPAGTDVVAPEAGRVLRLSGSPTSEPPRGTGKAFGLSEYIQGISGTIYFITHLGSENVATGQTVAQGQVLGTVADFSPYGVPSHAHVGARGPISVSQLATAPKISAESAALVTGTSGSENPRLQVTPAAQQGASFSNPLSGVTGATGSFLAPGGALFPGGFLGGAGTPASGVAKWLGIPQLPPNAIQRSAEMFGGAVIVLVALIMVGHSASAPVAAATLAKVAR